MGKSLITATAALAMALLTPRCALAQLLPGEIRDIDAELIEVVRKVPIPNAKWLCSTQVVGSTGGHPHMEPGRPAGRVEPREGTTNGAGRFTFKFFAPEVAGRYLVICVAPQFPNSGAVGNIDVSIDDLVPMPSSFEAGVYTLATDLRHADKIHYMARQVYKRPLQITVELKFVFPGMQTKMLGASTANGGVNDRIPNPAWVLNADPHRLGREFDGEFVGATYAEIDATSAKYNCPSSSLFFTDIHFFCSPILAVRPRPRAAYDWIEKEAEIVDITDDSLSNGMRLKLRPPQQEQVDEQVADAAGTLIAQAAPKPRAVGGGRDGRVRVEREPGKVRVRVPRRGRQADTVEFDEHVVELANGAEPSATGGWKAAGNGFEYELEVENGAKAAQAINAIWFDLDLEPSNASLTETPEGMRASPFRLGWNHKDASRGLARGEKTGRMKFYTELGPGFAELFVHGVREFPKLPHLGSEADAELYMGDGALSPRNVNRVIRIVGPAVERTVESLRGNIVLASSAPELAGIRDELLAIAELSAPVIRERLRGIKGGNAFQKRLIEAWLASLDRIN